MNPTRYGECTTVDRLVHSLINSPFPDRTLGQGSAFHPLISIFIIISSFVLSFLLVGSLINLPSNFILSLFLCFSPLSSSSSTSSSIDPYPSISTRFFILILLLSFNFSSCLPTNVSDTTFVPCSPVLLLSLRVSARGSRLLSVSYDQPHGRFD